MAAGWAGCASGGGRSPLKCPPGSCLNVFTHTVTGHHWFMFWAVAAADPSWMFSYYLLSHVPGPVEGLWSTKHFWSSTADQHYSLLMNNWSRYNGSIQLFWCDPSLQKIQDANLIWEDVIYTLCSRLSRLSTRFRLGVLFKQLHERFWFENGC